MILLSRASYRREMLAARAGATRLREEYDRYRGEAQAHVEKTDRVIAELRAELAGAVAERDHLRRIETLAIKEQDELRAELRAYRDTATVTVTGRLHPEPIQALVDWYLRKPMTAVLALPSRDSVRAALDAGDEADTAVVDGGCGGCTCCGDDCPDQHCPADSIGDAVCPCVAG